MPKAAGVIDAAATDGAMVKKTVKPRKPRAKALPAATDAAASEPAVPVATAPVQEPAVQSERSSLPDIASSPDRQAHIETQVIPPEAYRALEKRTAQVFGHDGGAQPGHASVPAATPA